jgi:hypothetical protein
VIGFDRWCWPFCDPESRVPTSGAAGMDRCAPPGGSVRGVGNPARRGLPGCRAGPVTERFHWRARARARDRWAVGQDRGRATGGVRRTNRGDVAGSDVNGDVRPPVPRVRAIPPGAGWPRIKLPAADEGLAGRWLARVFMLPPSFVTSSALAVSLRVRHALAKECDRWTTRNGWLSVFRSSGPICGRSRTGCLGRSARLTTRSRKRGCGSAAATPPRSRTWRRGSGRSWRGYR